MDPPIILAMPSPSLETAIDILKVGVQVAGTVPPAVPVQSGLGLALLMLERTQNLNKSTESLRSLAIKAHHQSLIASKFYEEPSLAEQQHELILRTSELYQSILTFIDNVKDASRWKNYCQVNNLARDVARYHDRLDLSFSVLMVNVLGSIHETQQVIQQSVLDQNDSRDEEFLDIIKRQELDLSQSAITKTRYIGDGIRTVTSLGRLGGNCNVLIKQYESENSQAARKAFKLELIKLRLLSNIVEYPIGRSGPVEAFPYIIYRMSDLEQRISYWDIQDTQRYALVVILAPAFLKNWQTIYGSVPICEEEYHLLADWLRDLTIVHGTSSGHKLLFSGDLAKVRSCKDSAEQWARFTMWFSWHLFFWAPPGAETQIRTLLAGMKGDMPHPSDIDLIARASDLGVTLNQLRWSRPADSQKPRIKIDGSEVVLGLKWCTLSSDMEETIIHRYTDPQSNCARTEWVVWDKNKKRGYRDSACNCDVPDPSHEPRIYCDFDQFLMTWTSPAKSH